MKRILCAFAAAAMLAGLIPMTAFAHGCHGGGYGWGYGSGASAAPRYGVCAADGCEVYGPHQHNGTWYCNQGGVNWNNYAVCAVPDCAAPGLHEHDGQWYHCPNYPYGGAYRGRGRGWN